MKSMNEMRKPEKDFRSGSDEQKKSRKLKPVAKEKNLKRVFYAEIEDLQDIELDYLNDEFEDEFDDDDIIDDEF